ncbi:MAG: putative DNA-binding protein [Tuberibacillus sp.]
MLEKTMRINALYDFYQPLLTHKQREYMDLYYADDYSLGEIAEMFGVSRQAVYDNLKRTESALEAFETKLGLYEKYNRRTKLLQELRDALGKGDLDTDKGLEIVRSLENLD